jgi:hypothetical protein
MDAHARLAGEYGAPLPPGLAGLSSEQATQLVEAIEAARRHQDEALRTATEAGLGFVPKVLRGPVKRVLFP